MDKLSKTASALAKSATVIVSIAMTAPVYAQSVMPWESPLRKLLLSLQGPTAQTIIILAIIVAGLAFAIGEAGSFFRRCAAAIFGGSIALGASAWAPMFLS